jgi:VanZ family protein
MLQAFLRWILISQKYVKYALWLSLLIIVVLSLVPGDARPHTGASGKFEHFIAYLGAGLFIAGRYQLLFLRLIFWAGTAALSFILEFFQQFVPGRGPDPLDALASSSGLTTGVLLGGVFIVFIRELRSSFVEASLQGAVD